VELVNLDRIHRRDVADQDKAISPSVGLVY
jgi:hypothetical protein